MPFTSFITSPINASTTVPVATHVEMHFTSAADAALTTVSLRTASGAEVAGILEVNGKSAVFRPSAPLAGTTAYQVEVHAVSSTGDEDVRHLGFTTE